MRQIFWTSLIALTIAGCGSSSVKNETATMPAYKLASEIPLEDFFKNPTTATYRISPDGKQLAYLKGWKNRMNVFVAPVSDLSKEKQYTRVDDRDLQGLMWKGNGHIVFSRDFGGDENTTISVIDLANGSIKELTPTKGVRAMIVDDLAEVSDTDVLLQHNQRNPEVFDLYRVNIATGETKMIAENKYKMDTWLIDHEGNPRGGSASDGVSSVFYYEKTKGQPYEVLFKTDFRNSFTPLGFTADNQRIYVLSNLKQNYVSLVEVDPKLPAEKFVRKVLFSYPRRDVEGASYSEVRKSINEISVVTDRRETFFLNPADQKEWTALKAKLSKDGLLLANATRDEKFWVVKTHTDRGCGVYYLYDRTAKNTSIIGDVCPWLPSHLMSPMKTVHYKTRDGLDIEGYLTIPLNSTGKNMPVVINPHGGPWARDEWGFDREVQFLASRGYAVFQTNFRGSTGYGRKFWEASFKQWGLKMQDDITDGVKWLTKQGIADKKRICIYGASYGGYATLAGLAFTPDLYACGVDYVGVANIFTLYKTIPPYWASFRDMQYAMIGHPEKDKDLLTKISPVFHVNKIKAPLFVAQGANDPRVNKAESDQIVEALKKRGVEVQYMVKDNEGHGFRNEENRFDFYRAMDKFLAQHIGTVTNKNATN